MEISRILFRNSLLFGLIGGLAPATFFLFVFLEINYFSVMGMIMVSSAMSIVHILIGAIVSPDYVNLNYLIRARKLVIGLSTGNLISLLTALTLLYVYSINLENRFIYTAGVGVIISSVTIYFIRPN